MVLLSWARLISAGLTHVSASVAGAGWSRKTAAGKAHLSHILQPASLGSSHGDRRLPRGPGGECARPLEVLDLAYIASAMFDWPHQLKSSPDSRGKEIDSASSWGRLQSIVAVFVIYQDRHLVISSFSQDE